MTRIILYEILRVVILNLLYTSMLSDGSRLYADEFNPLVGKPFKLIYDTESTITSIVTIKFPDGITAGYCDPPLPPVLVDCTGAAGYIPALNETTNIVTIITSNLSSDVNGTWTCTYDSETVSYILTTPIREIKDESFTLFPTSFTDNITNETTSVSLSATYGCINLPVDFKWFVVDSASTKIDIDINGTNNAVENSSVCTSLSGFNGYTETKVHGDVYSINSVRNLDGSYRLGVEVHYMDEVTTLHSIKYFDTYFVFKPPTASSTDATAPGKTNDASKDNAEETIIGAGLGTFGLIIIITIIVCFMRKKTIHDNATNTNQNKTKNKWIKTSNNSGNSEHVPMPGEHHADYNRRNNYGNPEHVSMTSEHHADHNRSNNSGNPELVPIPNEHHVDYNRRNNYGDPEHVAMPNEHHVDYKRRNNSCNPEHVPMPNEHHVDYNRRNNAGKPERAPMPNC